jgi:hypothetical protein
VVARFHQARLSFGDARFGVALCTASAQAMADSDSTDKQSNCQQGD